MFHAGTQVNESGDLLTSGGRVISIAAQRSNLKLALDACYTNIPRISFEGMVYRRDIGYRALPKNVCRLGVLGSTRGTDLQVFKYSL